MTPPRLDEELVRQLVEGHLLTRGDRILEVRIGSAAAIVATARRSWRLDELDRIGGVPTGSGYRLFDADTAITDSSGPTIGLARLADGRVFDLTHGDQLQAFQAAVDPPLDPLEAACLVATFVEPEDERRRVADGESLPDLGKPAVTSSSGDGRTVTVYTARTQFDDDETSFRVVERWEVAVGPGTLSWRHDRV